MSIYIIKSKDLSLHDIYIGSCKDMKSRRRCHKSRCCNEKSKYYNLKLYQFIRANGGFNNFVMEEIENCNTERLYQVEQHYIDTFNPSLNERRAYITEEQRKEHKKESDKKYYGKNKDKINKKIKEKFTCVCGSTIRRGEKARHFKSIKHKSFIENN